MKKLLVGFLLAPLLVLGLMAVGLSTSLVGGGPPSAQAQRDIPPNLLPLYQAAADTCPGLPWSVLAAIGKVESDHGRSTAPGVASGANFAGAAGPMQIGIGGKAGNTFGTYAVDADGGGASVYSPADAAFTAANYLCRNGAAQGRDVAGAVFAYNHADWYVTKVLATASNYAASAARMGTAAAPSEAAAAAVQFAYNQLGKPYVWGAEGDNFYDCSGLMVRAYQEAGIQLPRTSREHWYAGARVLNVGHVEPGDLVFRARNLSDPSTISHVGMYVGAGNIIVAPYTARWCGSSRWCWRTTSAPFGRPCRRPEPACAPPPPRLVPCLDRSDRSLAGRPPSETRPQRAAAGSWPPTPRRRYWPGTS